MDAGLIIFINLPGQIGPMKKHDEKQTFSADVSPIGAKPEILTRKIKHVDRGTQTCMKQLKIAASTVDFWKYGDCPIWADPKIWKKLSPNQRVFAYVQTFDEGYGVTFE